MCIAIGGIIMAAKKLDYKKMNIDDIILWCKEHGQVDWLKETASKQVTCAVYPKKTIIDANGKKKTVADKDAKPTFEMRPITFIQIKKAFVEEFMPEIMPKAKAKAPTMHERIKNL